MFSKEKEFFFFSMKDNMAQANGIVELLAFLFLTQTKSLLSPSSYFALNSQSKINIELSIECILALLCWRRYFHLGFYFGAHFPEM
jgi:hypothetical protein